MVPIDPTLDCLDSMGDDLDVEIRPIVFPLESLECRFALGGDLDRRKSRENRPRSVFCSRVVGCSGMLGERGGRESGGDGGDEVEGMRLFFSGGTSVIRTSAYAEGPRGRIRLCRAGQRWDSCALSRRMILCQVFLPALSAGGL